MEAFLLTVDFRSDAKNVMLTDPGTRHNEQCTKNKGFGPSFTLVRLAFILQYKDQTGPMGAINY